LNSQKWFCIVVWIWHTVIQVLLGVPYTFKFVS
jgi:hypothetical protein